MFADPPAGLRFLAGGRLPEIDEQRTHPGLAVEMICKARGRVDAAAEQDKCLRRLGAFILG